MNICFYIDSLGSGGAQRQIVGLATEMKKRGHAVSFITYHPDDFFREKLDENNIEQVCISAKSKFDLIVKTRRHFQHVNPDVVISFLTSPGLISCMVSILPHKWKLITGERNSKDFIFNGFSGKMLVWSERFSDWKVANSEVGKEMWVQRCPQYSDKISTIYNPVDVNFEAESKSVEHSLKRRIVIAASYQYTKNPVRVAEAVSKLSQEERDRIVIEWFGRIEANKGDSRAYDEASEVIVNNGLENTLCLHGETKTIYDEMRMANAVALFSTVEGLPNAICEGMMLGKPVLMTPVSDYRVFVTPENGFLCNDAEANSICSVLKQFINTSDEALDRMGKRSKDLANKLFDFRTNMDKWEALIFKLAK